MKTTKLLGAALAGALLLAACGDDGADSNEYADALATTLDEQEGSPFSDEENSCLAGEMIDAVGGPSALEDAGITPEDIRGSQEIAALDLDVDEAEEEELARSFSDCDISLADAVIDQLGDQVPAEVKQCLSDNITDEGLADVFADALVSGEAPSGDDLPPELMPAFTECISDGS